MNKFLKWTLTSVLAVVILLFAAIISINSSFNGKLNQLYNLAEIENWPIDATAENIELGGRLSVFRGCTDCHGANLGGKLLIDDPMIGSVHTPNITRGQGGLPADWDRIDWVRSLKHGVKRNGQSLLLMPSYETTHMTRDDMGALIAYLEQVPPVNSVPTQIQFKPLGKLLSILDELPTFVAHKINHEAALVTQLESGPTATYGAYLAVTCTGCHRADFKGGKHPNPGMPQASDITASTGNMGRYSFEEFKRMLTTGKRPDGSLMNAEAMPWPMLTVLNEVEIVALYHCFRTL